MLSTASQHREVVSFATNRTGKVNGFSRPDSLRSSAATPIQVRWKAEFKLCLLLAVPAEQTQAECEWVGLVFKIPYTNGTCSKPTSQTYAAPGLRCSIRGRVLSSRRALETAVAVE